MATTITQKGQVTIPKEVRDFLGLRPGQKVSFKIEGDHAVVRKDEGLSGSIEQWLGFAKAKWKSAKSIDAYLTQTRGRAKPRRS